MGLVMEIVRTVRTTRAEYRVDPGKFVSASLATGQELKLLQGEIDIISRLARLQPLAIYEAISDKPADAVALLIDDVSVYLPLSEMTDVAAERARLAKELESAQNARRAVDAKLSNDDFLSRAPEAVVSRERERAQALAERISRLRERLDVLPE